MWPINWANNIFSGIQQPLINSIDIYMCNGFAFALFHTVALKSTLTPSNYSLVSISAFWLNNKIIMCIKFTQFMQNKTKNNMITFSHQYFQITWMNIWSKFKHIAGCRFVGFYPNNRNFRTIFQNQLKWWKMVDLGFFWHFWNPLDEISLHFPKST